LGEILPIWANFPQISKFLAGILTKFAQIEKKSPTNFGAKLNCADSPVFGRTKITVYWNFSKIGLLKSAILIYAAISNLKKKVSP
jgi:hypothetical protein